MRQEIDKLRKEISLNDSELVQLERDVLEKFYQVQAKVLKKLNFNLP